MTIQDRKTLLHFLTKTGMYIHPCDDSNINSFILGYDLGRNKECLFVEKLYHVLSHKYKAGSTSSGWWGQIHRLSKKKSIDWVVIFKQIALEIIMDIDENSSKQQLQEIIKSKFIILIGNFKEKSQHFTINEWLSFYSKNIWFTDMWTKQELKEIRAIHKELLNR